MRRAYLSVSDDDAARGAGFGFGWTGMGMSPSSPNQRFAHPTPSPLVRFSSSQMNCRGDLPIPSLVKSVIRPRAKPAISTESPPLLPNRTSLLLDIFVLGEPRK